MGSPNLEFDPLQGEPQGIPLPPCAPHFDNLADIFIMIFSPDIAGITFFLLILLLYLPRALNISHCHKVRANCGCGRRFLDAAENPLGAAALCPESCDTATCSKWSMCRVRDVSVSVSAFFAIFLRVVVVRLLCFTHRYVGTGCP